MTEIFMPKAGMDMKEGRLIRWLKEIGDHVEKDEPIMEIETDKITMEAEAPATGILLAKLIDDETTVPVLQTIGYIGQPGEKIPDAPVAAADTPAAAPVETAAETAAPASKLPVLNGSVAATPYAKKLAAEKGVELAAVTASGPAGEVRASDVLAAAQSGAVNATALAKKYAEVNGVDLSAVSGTGHDGKIRKNDVLNAAAPAQREITRIPLTPIRKAIARNMFNSLHSMAQTSDSVEIDVTELMALRQRLLAHKDELGTKATSRFTHKAGIKLIEGFREPINKMLEASTRFEPYPSVWELAEKAGQVLSLCNTMGEGWLLTAEMCDLIETGTPNIVCCSPFACLPNHVVGKAVIKRLREMHPESNIVAVDYDPGASEVNQLNRIKLMISVAKENYRNNRGEGFKLEGDPEGGDDFGLPLTPEQREHLADIKARAAVD